MLPAKETRFCCGYESICVHQRALLFTFLSYSLLMQPDGTKLFQNPMSHHSTSIEPLEGIEPSTSSLPRKCSTTEPQRLVKVLESVGQTLFDFFDLFL